MDPAPAENRAGARALARYRELAAEAFLPLLAAVLGGLVYLNALHNPFVYDDYHTVVENRSILELTDLPTIVLGAVTRPIVNFSYAFDRAIWGPLPFGFHLTNVILHMVNVLLLFGLARHVGKGDFVAFAASGLLAMHPMMTEAVGYISGRSEVLCATFFMLALMSGSRWLAEGGARWAFRTAGLWAAALATKESAAMFPFVLLAYDRLALPADDIARSRRVRQVHLPLLSTAVLAGIVRLLVFARVEYPGQVTLHWNYLLLELDVVRRYLAMIAIPSGQALFHEVASIDLWDLRAWIAVLAVAGLAAVGARLRRADWVAGFGVFWFLLVLVPSSVLIALDQGEPMAEHRVYLASCGIFLSIGSGIGWLGGRLRGADARVRLLGASIFALVMLSLGAMTIVRNAVWADPVRLWRESADLAPTHYRPRLLLGEALQDAGRRQEALQEYQTAIRLRPTDPTGYVKVGQVLAEDGRWPEARRQFLKALEIEPRHTAATNALAVLDEVESRFGIDSPRR
jgi:protein O-mannosyl-transferase